MSHWPQPSSPCTCPEGWAATMGRQKGDRVAAGQEQVAGCVGTGTSEQWLWRHRQGTRAGVTPAYHRLAAVGQEVGRDGTSKTITGIACSVLVAMLQTEIGKLGKQPQKWLQSLKVTVDYQF